jgi:phytoene desaturase
MPDKTIGIIGAGLGGLSAAIRLAKVGFQVSLFEKNSSLGGKMNQIQHDGFRFDTGPSLLTMPFVVDELFDFAGIDRNGCLEFERIDPICRYFYPDGTRFQAKSDLVSMLEEFEEIFPEEKISYERFLNYTEKIFETTAEVFLFTPMHEIRKLINFKTLLLLFKSYRIDPFRTVNDAVENFFKDQRLVQIFNRYATYNGSNPYQAPATLNIITYVENVLGAYYIKGGMYRLIQELEKIAKQLGVHIYPETPVEKILVKDKQVSGIHINNELISFDYIVCNSDVVETFNHLIECEPRIQSQLQKLEPSLSGLVFLWSIRGTYEDLAHHNILFTNDYEKEFTQIFNELKPPDDPTVYISITQKSDPNHAPVDHENWFVLINMPYLTNDENWPEITHKIRAAIFMKLRSHGIDIENKILSEKIITPQDFYDKYQSNRGSIYGLSSNSRNTAFTRPANRNRRLKGLYFASGSVHPGGGVPLALLSGKMVSDLISEREGLKLENRLPLYLEKHQASISD